MFFDHVQCQIVFLSRFLLHFTQEAPPPSHHLLWRELAHDIGLHSPLLTTGGYYVPVVATGGFSDPPGSIYRSILSSCSFYRKIFTTGAS